MDQKGNWEENSLSSRVFEIKVPQRKKKKSDRIDIVNCPEKEYNKEMKLIIDYYWRLELEYGSIQKTRSMQM